jgi:uncharacterized membrane protein YkvA (DUF1232 family)
MKGRESVDENCKGFSEEELKGVIGSCEAEAKRILEDEGKLKQLHGKAKKTIKKIKDVPVIGGLVDDLLTIFDLIGDYAKGNYKKIPLRVIVSAVAGVIYLVSPIDIVPDFIPIAGWIDDAAVLTLILNAGLALELRKYKKWKLEIKKDEFIGNLQSKIADVVKERYLVAMFLTDDDTLKLLTSTSSDGSLLPIEVKPELLEFDYTGLKSICEELNVEVLNVLDEIRNQLKNEDAEILIIDIKVCRESDFTDFDETFEIVTEED